MQLVFLGTSCAKPTKDRNHSSIFLSFGSDGILFDCGEGTQRQLAIAGIRPTKINKVLISHWHGDHVLGLPGLIYTLGLSEYSQTLKIFGPKGSKRFVQHMLSFTVDNPRIHLEVIEVEEGVFFDGKDYQLSAVALEHRCPTVGFSFVEKDRRRIDVKVIKKLGIPQGPLLGKLQSGKSVTFDGKKISPKDTTYVVPGKKIAYIADTVLCKGAFDLAKDADLVIAASTYADVDKDKAEQHSHLTSQQAAQIASQANAKQLILTHFSTRYKDVDVLLDDAKTIFDNTIAAYDFLRFKL